MILRDLIHTDVADVFLNTEDFAETLYYKPANGTQRTITGVVDEDDEYVENEFGLFSMKVLNVFVSRDSTTGINEPQLGDRISRAIDGTGSAAIWYAFAGNTTEVDENAWTMKFNRETPYKIGGNRQ